MGNTRRKPEPEKPKRRGRPATTPQEREHQLIKLAVDCVEEQLRNGTASAQVITHYLKLGSTREQLEQKKLEGENQLLKARVEGLTSQKRVEELYDEALTAMREYQGQEVGDYDE